MGFNVKINLLHTLKGKYQDVPFQSLYQSEAALGATRLSHL